MLPEKKVAKKIVQKRPLLERCDKEKVPPLPLLLPVLVYVLDTGGIF